MDSTPTPTEELAWIARQLRVRLGRHAAAGTWAAPGGLTARSAAIPEIIEDRDDGGEQALRDAPLRRSLAQIREDVGDCPRCKLSVTRRKIVFGVGDPSAPLMFVGEAPGEQEDRTGEPFVGPAGELLDKMIVAMGWARKDVYITNTLMCRPPKNRTPEPDELAACAPFLNAKLQAVRPRIIVALGRPAANQLLGTDAPINALRGKFHERHGARVMPTFHPAYLLREPAKKADAWHDLKLVMAELERLGIAPPAKS